VKARSLTHSRPFRSERVGPWKGLDDVEFATLEWVAWYNSQRLMEPLGYVPPAEYEEQFHRALVDSPTLVLNEPSLRKTPGRFSQAGRA